MCTWCKNNAFLSFIAQGANGHYQAIRRASVPHHAHFVAFALQLLTEHAQLCLQARNMLYAIDVLYLLMLITCCSCSKRTRTERAFHTFLSNLTFLCACHAHLRTIFRFFVLIHLPLRCIRFKTLFILAAKFKIESASSRSTFISGDKLLTLLERTARAPNAMLLLAVGLFATCPPCASMICTHIPMRTTAPQKRAHAAPAFSSIWPFLEPSTTRRGVFVLGEVALVCATEHPGLESSFRRNVLQVLLPLELNRSRMLGK